MNFILNFLIINREIRLESEINTHQAPNVGRIFFAYKLTEPYYKLSGAFIAAIWEQNSKYSKYTPWLEQLTSEQEQQEWDSQEPKLEGHRHDGETFQLFVLSRLFWLPIEL